MDIRARIDEIVNRVKGDPDIAAKFQKDPIKTVEGIIGVDLRSEERRVGKECRSRWSPYH